ncbi:GGDEF domain-containing protein [Fusibacter ferrireducens]|uniref:GGDEF domain-containing protein n=1 Tax=Fusibacter ferrireducens TaxID=2785058 RepID=A0ABR9ZST3_9FIRM|nr:GGDEF domain-containing protein [Fusibacter ferrireducens]MBF4693535.1 GGDEF domain-containing protein [Fusibacter ferrireducens]
MNMFDKYQRTTESVKDNISEENRKLTRQLAESRQSFELLKFVHFDKTINLEMLNDIIVGCTGCLYSFMYYLDRTITNLDSDHPIYKLISMNKERLLNHETLFVDYDLIANHTVVVYPVSVSQMISSEFLIHNIILVYPSKFVTDEALEFVKNFMIVNDVLINIVLMREKMYELIETDPLTTLLNRSSWNSNLESIVSSGDPFFIIFIDIDNFKVLNDTYGHQKGDEVLKIAGTWLKNAFRDDDKVYRLGGDEFAVTGKVNVHTIEGLFYKFETLTKKYSHTIKMFLGIDSKISIGALITEKPKDIETIYTRVDALLYESKKKGRDQVHIVSDF